MSYICVKRTLDLSQNAGFSGASETCEDSEMDFFGARDRQALGHWYRDNLGVGLVPANYHEQVWHQEAGPTVFAPFPESTDYFGADSGKLWMMNFRVRSLDAMVAQLLAAGVPVEFNPQPYPNGRFARLYDPEGNPIELWEPAGRDAPAQS